MWHILLIPNIPNCDLEPTFPWMDTKLITPVLCSANFVPDLYSIKPFWLSWQMISATGTTILSCFQARNMEGILDIFLFWSLRLTYQQVLSISALKQLSNPPTSLHCYYYPGPCHLLPSSEHCKTLLTGLPIFTTTPLQSIIFPESRTIFTKHMWSPNSTAFRMSQHHIRQSMRPSIVQPYLPFQPSPVPKKKYIYIFPIACLSFIPQKLPAPSCLRIPYQETLPSVFAVTPAVIILGSQLKPHFLKEGSPGFVLDPCSKKLNLQLQLEVAITEVAILT